MSSTFLDKFPNLSNSVLLFYISLLSGWGDKLLPPRVTDFLEANRLAQIIAAYFLVVFSIEVFNDKVTSIGQSFGYAFAIFGLYILISKQNPKFFLLSIGLLLVNYFIHKELVILRENVTEDTKKKEKELSKIHKILTYITIGVISVGFITYFMKQYKEYGSESSNVGEFLLKFLLEGSNRMYEAKDRVF
tara:strand:- start:22 stop:591 length:570 start_codon:yes stop_codon:yes gene_type:complete